MAKYLIGVVVFVVVATGAYYAWQALGTSLVPPPEEEEATTMSTYATTTFSVTYPSTYTVNDAYTYDEFKGKPIAGVKFTVPAAATEGTNLSSDTGISVEWLPRAKTCTGDIYILANVKAVSLMVGSTTYSVATTSGAAAGNLYEEQVYAISGSKPCTAVRYFIHSGNIGNFTQEGESSTREFDRTALLREFDEIRNSLLLSQ
ncbi:hypothetical protein A3A39_01150 [Candidatus Kaiserbacteria bacterium RIFCSPLOWO2_01_FULL_54_13]|uniref:Uncharacterized protein n=1 Tax=Candidatus Kaiserbacteria bacterium RIFCSPLOWO2_01_FULL_54_13 TaxID=1798512 RepID=A0A1F6F2A1_9BACT|nr:MAG: hypothetical protein A3A39_01150 [Candidatus Kaiserbacteria bacterium RIFCSPLOWO2_01_FULL_54_13]